MIWRDDGTNKLQIYSLGGQLMFEQRQTAAGPSNMRYVYLDRKQLANEVKYKSTSQLRVTQNRG